MKPGRGGSKKRVKLPMEEVKEERDLNHDIDEEDDNRHSQSAKKGDSKVPRAMKAGTKTNPARELLTRDQRAEKYYELLEENSRLKTHQTELDDDIK